MQDSTGKQYLLKSILADYRESARLDRNVRTFSADQSQFLRIDEELPAIPKKRGRRPVWGAIGQIGAGKDRPNGVIDVGIMQSLTQTGKPLVRPVRLEKL